MQIQSNPKIEPLHLFYAPLYKQRENLFLRYHSTEKVLTQKDLKDSLLAQKVFFQAAQLPCLTVGFRYSGRAMFAIGALSMTMTMAIVYSQINEIFNFALEELGSQTEVCINKGNDTMPDALYYPRTPFQRRGNWRGTPGFEGLAFVIPAEWMVFCMFGMVVCNLLNVRETCEVAALNRAKQKASDEIDAIINTLPAMIGSDHVEVSAHELCKAFPYLSEDLLKLLNFTQLAEAKEAWTVLFQERLAASLYSKPQLAIWRLFDHLLDAEEYMQKQILSDKLNQKIIAGDPVFFQALFIALQPQDEEIKSIFKRIFKKKLMRPDMANKLTADNFRGIFQHMERGGNLLDMLGAIAQASSPSQAADTQDPFAEFLTHGRLDIQSSPEYCAYYKRIFEHGDPHLKQWFESYAIPYIDYMASNPYILEDLGQMGADSLLLKIDTYLSRSNLPAFHTDDFAACYTFAKKHLLHQYSHSLNEHCLAEIESYAFHATPGHKVYDEIQTMRRQIEISFADHMQPFLDALEKRVLTLLPSLPKMIAKLAELAQINNNAWMLDLLKRAYSSNQTLYDTHWLCPFPDQHSPLS